MEEDEEIDFEKVLMEENLKLIEQEKRDAEVAQKLIEDAISKQEAD
jgi:hypothetical protein